MNWIKGKESNKIMQLLHLIKLMPRYWYGTNLHYYIKHWHLYLPLYVIQHEENEEKSLKNV